MRRKKSDESYDRLYELEMLEPRIMLSTEGADALAAGLGNLAQTVIYVQETEESLNRDLPLANDAIADLCDPSESINEAFDPDLDDDSETSYPTAQTTETDSESESEAVAANATDAPDPHALEDAAGSHSLESDLQDPAGALAPEENADVQTRQLTTSLCCANAPPTVGITSDPSALDDLISDDYVAELIAILERFDTLAAEIDAGPAMSADIPLIDRSLADIVGFTNLLGENFTGPISDYLAEPAPTYQGLIDVLNDQVASLDEPVVHEWRDGELFLHIPLRATVTWETSLSFDAPLQGLTLDLGGILVGNAYAEFDLVLGFNLPEPQAEGQLVFIQPGALKIDLDLDATDPDASLRIGMFEAAVTDGSLDFQAGFTAGWNSMGQERLTQASLADLHGAHLLSDPVWHGALDADMPFAIAAPGLTAQGNVGVTLADINAPEDIEFVIEGLDDLPDLRNLTADKVIALLKTLPDQALSKLETQGDAWLYRPLPVLNRSMADLLEDANRTLAQLDDLAQRDFSLPALMAAIEDELGLEPGTLEWWLELIEDNGDTILRLRLAGDLTLTDVNHTWGIDKNLLSGVFGEHLPLLLSSLLPESGFTGTLTGQVRLDFDLDAGLDISEVEGNALIDPFLVGGAGLTIGVLVHGGNINLDLNILSGKTLWINDGHFRMGTDPTATVLLEPMTLIIALDGNTDEFYSVAPEAPQLFFSTSLTGGFEFRLPVHYGETTDGPEAANYCGDLFLFMADFNDPSAFSAGTPDLQPILDDLGNGLSRGQMLDLLVRLAKWFDGLTEGQLFAQRLPLTDRTLGELLDLGATLQHRINELENTAFNSAQELADRIETLFNWATELEDDMLSFRATINHTWEWDVGFQQDFPGLTIDAAAAGSFAAGVELDFDFDVMLDLSGLEEDVDWGQSALDRVAIHNLEVAATFTLAPEDVQALVRWGVLGLTAGLTGELGSGNALNASIGMSALQSETPVFLRELKAKLDTIHNYIEAPALAGQAHLVLDIDANLSAGTDVSLATLLGDEPSIEIEWSWDGVAEPHRANVTLHGLDGLPSFSRLDFNDLVEMLRALGRTFERLAGDAALNWEVPLTGGRTLGELIALGDLYAERVLAVLDELEDTEDNAQATYQEMRRRLIEALGLAEEDVSLDADAMLFHLNLEPLVNQWSQTGGFREGQLGPFDFAASGTLSGQVATGLSLTIGVDLNPPPLELVAASAVVETNLTADLAFLLTGVGEGMQPVTITVAAGTYNTVEALVAALNAALAAAQVGHLVEAVSLELESGEHLVLRTLPGPGGARYLGIAGAADPAALDRLGFELLQNVYHVPTDLMFIQNVMISAELGLSITNLSGAVIFGDLARLNVVNGRLILSDELGGTGPARIDVAFGEADVRIPFSEIRKMAKPDAVYSAAAALNFSLAADIPGLTQFEANNNSVTIKIDDLGNPLNAEIKSVGLDDLFAFETLDLNDIIDLLVWLLETLDVDLDNIMDVKIPLLNKTGNELFDYVDGVLDSIDLALDRVDAFLDEFYDRVEAASDRVDAFFDRVEAAADYPRSKLEELNEYIKDVLPEGTSIVFVPMAADADLGLPAALQLNLTVGYTSSGALPLDLDLLALLPDDIAGALAGMVNISTDGRLDLLSARTNINVGAGIQMTRDFERYLTRDSEMEFTLLVEGSGLKFDAALGPFGVHVEDGTAGISETLDNTDQQAFIRYGFADSSDGPRVDLAGNEDFNWFTEAELEIVGAIAANLPVFFPTKDEPVGSLKLEIADLGALLSALFRGEEINVYVIDSGGEGLVGYQLPDFSEVTVELDLNLILQGLEMLLTQLADALDSGAFGQRLPVVGSLDDAAGFLRDMAAGVATLRETLPTTRDELITRVTDQITSALDNLGLDDLFTLEFVAEDIEDGDGEEGGHRFKLSLNGAYALAAESVSFDIGLPALGLDVSDASVTTNIGFDATLSFGYCPKNGFFLEDNSAVELELQAELDLELLDADKGVTGRLGFLEVLVGNAAEAEQAALLSAGMALALTEEGPVYFADLHSRPLSERFDFDWNVATDVNLDIMVQFAGGTSSFPSIRGDLNMAWGWGNKTSDAYPDTPFVELANVRLDLGYFLDNTVGPVLRWIDDLLEPIRPLVDFLTAPVPGVSELAGRNVSLLDMARASAQTVDMQFIDAVIKIVDILADLPSFDGAGYLVLVESFVLNQDPQEPLDEIDFEALAQQEAPDTENIEDEDARNIFARLGDIGIRFPVIESPAQVISLLFGRDVDLIVYDMPALELGFDYRLNVPFWSPPTIAVSIGAGVGVTIDPVFGYDTRGARLYMQARAARQADDQQPEPSLSLLLNGFYALAVPDRPPLSLNAEVFAGLMLNVGVTAGIDGGVALDVRLGFKDPQGVGKLYVDDLLAYKDTTLGMFCAFTASGEVSAFLRFWYEAWLWSGDYTIVEVTLFDFNVTPECKPLEDEGPDGVAIRRMEEFDANAFYAAIDAGVVPGVNRGMTDYAAAGSQREITKPDPENPLEMVTHAVDTHGANWYRVELLHPDDLRIMMRNFSSGYLGLFDSDGTLIANGQIGLDVRGLQPGVYYVGVGRPETSWLNEPWEYELSITPLPGRSNTVVWYINDADYAHDPAAPTHYYTLAAGNDGNSGRTPSAPLASLAGLPSALDTSKRHLVVFDTGTYTSQTLTQSGLTLVGAPGVDELPGEEIFDIKVGQSIFWHGDGQFGLHLDDVQLTLVHGLTFINPNSGNADKRAGPGILVTGTAASGMGVNTLRRNLFLNSGEAAVAASSVQPLMVADNLFFVLAQGHGNGLEILGQNRAVIRDNVFRLDNAVLIDSPFYSQVSNNDIVVNGFGVMVTEGGSARIGDNFFGGGEYGVIVRSEHATLVEYNTFEEVAILGVFVDQPAVPTFLAIDFEGWMWLEPQTPPGDWYIIKAGIDATETGATPERSVMGEDAPTTITPTALPLLDLPPFQLERLRLAEAGIFIAEFPEPVYRHLIVNNTMKDMAGYAVGLATLTPTQVLDNRMIGGMGGVLVFGDNPVNHLIERNHIEDAGIGIAVTDSAVAVIRDNRIDNARSYAIGLFSERDSLVRDNRITGAAVGVQIGFRQTPPDGVEAFVVEGGGIVRHNTIISTDAGVGIRLAASHRVRIENNRIEGGALGLFALGEHADPIVITRNYIVGAMIGIRLDGQAAATILDNTLHSVNVGVILASDRASLVQNNLISGALPDVEGWPVDQEPPPATHVDPTKRVDGTIGMAGVMVGMRHIQTGDLLYSGSGTIDGNTIVRFQVGIRLDTPHTVPVINNEIRWVGHGVQSTVFGVAAHLVDNTILMPGMLDMLRAVDFSFRLSDFSDGIPDTLPSGSSKHLLRDNLITAETPLLEGWGIALPVTVILNSGPAATIENNTVHGMFGLMQHASATRSTLVAGNRITHGLAIVADADTVVRNNDVGLEGDLFHYHDGYDIQTLEIDRGGISIREIRDTSFAVHRVYDNTVRGGMLFVDLENLTPYLLGIGVYGGARVEIYDNTVTRGGVEAQPGKAVWHFYNYEGYDLPVARIENNTIAGGIRLSVADSDWFAKDPRIIANTLTDDDTGRQQFENVLAAHSGETPVTDEVRAQYLSAFFDACLQVVINGGLVVNANSAPAGAELEAQGHVEVIDNRFAEGPLHIVIDVDYWIVRAVRVEDNLIGNGLDIAGGGYATILGNTVLAGGMHVELPAEAVGDFTHLRDNLIEGTVDLKLAGRARIEHNVITGGGLTIGGVGVEPHSIDYNYIGGRLDLSSVSSQPHRVRGNTIEGGYYGLTLGDLVSAEIYDNPLIKGEAYGIQGLQPGRVVILNNPHIEGGLHAIQLIQPASSRMAFNEIVGGIQVLANSDTLGDGPVVIEHNIIRDGNAHGVEIMIGERVDQALVAFNAIHNNIASGVHYGGMVRVAGNRIYANTDGITGEEAAADPLLPRQAIIVGNELFGNTGAAIRATPLLIDGNHIHRNAAGIVISAVTQGRQHFVGEIVNNLIHDNGAVGIEIVCDYVETINNRTPRVINNTVYQPDGDALRVVFRGDIRQTDPVQPLDVFNNILVGAPAASLVLPDGLPPGLWRSDYNLFHGSADTVISIRGNAMSLADWQSDSRWGQDLNGLQADPRFMDAVRRDFRLDRISPAIDRGHSWERPLTDRDGFERVAHPEINNAGSADYMERLHDTSGFSLDGDALNWEADNDALLYDLPFALTFYGVEFDQVWISSNGFLQFGGSLAEAASPYNDVDTLRERWIIAPLWTDLYTEEMFVSSASGRIVFRWQARTANGNAPVNMAVMLQDDGGISFHYGPDNAGLLRPTVGISGFGREVYLLSRYNMAKNLDQAPSVVFELVPGHVDLGAYEYRVATGEEPLAHVRGVAPEALHPIAGNGVPSLIVEALTCIVVELSAPLDPVAANNPAAFDLRRTSADSAVIELRPAYVPGSLSLTLHLIGGALEAGDYRLTLISAELPDLLGRALDGNRDGKAGGDYVRQFTVATPALVLDPQLPLVTAPLISTSVDVRLSSQPLQPVHVVGYSSHPQLGSAFPDDVLVFTPDNWDIPQTYTIWGESGVYDFTQIYQFSFVTLYSQDPRFEDIESETLDVLHYNLYDAVPTGVVDRHVFYNNSVFDGHNPAAGIADNAAIDPSKTALLPGQTATFANYTGYSRGLNGIMIDIIDPVAIPTVADFVFRIGNDNYPSGWTTAPDPVSFSVSSPHIPNGKVRVTIIWEDDALRNTWLQVTALADDNGGALGLDAGDVFYFGNTVGKTRDGSGHAFVDAADFVAVRDNFRGAGNPAPVSDSLDVNKDGLVDHADLALVRDNGTNFQTALKLISAPMTTSALVVVTNIAPAAYAFAGHAEDVPSKPSLRTNSAIEDSLTDESLAIDWEGENSREPLLIQSTQSVSLPVSPLPAVNRQGDDGPTDVVSNRPTVQKQDDGVRQTALITTRFAWQNMRIRGYDTRENCLSEFVLSASMQNAGIWDVYSNRTDATAGEWSLPEPDSEWFSALSAFGLRWFDGVFNATQSGDNPPYFLS